MLVLVVELLLVVVVVVIVVVDVGLVDEEAVEGVMDVLGRTMVGEPGKGKLRSNWGAIFLIGWLLVRESSEGGGLNGVR
jgi:hypothetical protein